MGILKRARRMFRHGPPSKRLDSLGGRPSINVTRDHRGNVTVHLGRLRDEINAIRRLEGEARAEFLRTGRVTLMGGAAGTWTFVNSTRTNLLNGTFDIDSDTWKMALLLSTSNIGAGSTTHAGVTNEVANGAGYTTGGAAITLTLSGTTTVTVDVSTDPVWTASGGPITAHFAEIYEVSGNVLCYALLESTGPADVTATDGNTLTVAAHASGVFTLA